jgi:hypothetical protein
MGNHTPFKPQDLVSKWDKNKQQLSRSNLVENSSDPGTILAERDTSSIHSTAARGRWRGLYSTHESLK